MGGHKALLTRLYEAFNRKDIDAVVGLMHPDVSWPNLFGDDRMHGREALRAMWRDQFAKIDPEGAPISMSTLPDGRIAVKVAYVVRTLDGRLFTEEVVTNTYQFLDDQIIGMEWD
jgi:ketosteroid isomerase-like protein